MTTTPWKRQKSTDGGDKYNHFTPGGIIIVTMSHFNNQFSGSRTANALDMYLKGTWFESQLSY
jgi:hypothetical protein